MSASSSSRKNSKPDQFDPEEFRMSIGDHLEELRRRIVFGFLGLAVAVIICMIFGERVIVTFCAPLISELRKKDLNAQIYYTEISGVFMTYLKVSLISALAIAGPWLIYQIWLFVAAGLYAHERKMVTRYIPMSIALLIIGMVFVYVLVLPWTVRFLLEFSGGIPLPSGTSITATQPSDTTPKVFIPEYIGDPAKPADRELWINKTDGRLKMFMYGKVRVIQFGPENLMAPMITINDYIDLVLLMMVTFGAAFQLPLVVMAVVKVGLVDVKWLRGARRYVYFAMTILAAIMAPADVVTAMLALLIPLIFLYEFGIFMAAWGQKKAAEAAKAER